MLRKSAFPAIDDGRRWVIAVCATLLVLAWASRVPAAAEAADSTGTPSLTSRVAAIAGNLQGDAERYLLSPSRQAAQDLLASPATGKMCDIVARTAAGLAEITRSFVLEPVARESARLLRRPEIRQAYQVAAGVANSAGEGLRSSVMAAGAEPAAQGPGPDPVLSWLATAGDVPRPAVARAIPDPSDRDTLSSLEDDDPLEPLNRLVFEFNRPFQAYVLDPAGSFYANELPAGLRTNIRNFFGNLREPATFVSSVLEGQLQEAGIAGARFGVNSTLGVVGFFDPATDMGLTARPRTLEETLCRYGLPSGPYLVLPVLGPATLRDAAGRLATVVMYFEVMGANIYVPYRVADIAVRYTEGKPERDAAGSLASDPYVAEKAFYRMISNRGCGRQAAADSRISARQ